MKKSIQKKSSKGKMKRLLIGGLATATLLTSMAFVGCADKTPVNPNPDNGNNNGGSSTVIVEANHATSVSDLLARYTEETEAFIATQFDTVLNDLGIEDDISADYKINSNEQGITSIKYTFEHNRQKYIAFASYSSPVEFDTIANYNHTKEYTDKANMAIENSTTQYDVQDILNHVSSYSELEENYSTKLNQYLKTQFEYVLEKYNITNDKETPVSDLTQKVTADENGITKVEFSFTHEDKEQTITVSYTSPISLDAIANYPEHEASKEEVVNAILSAQSEHEVKTPIYSDEYILANFQDQINANLFSGVQQFLKDYCKGTRTEYDENKISYQWHFGEIKDSTVQDLQVYIKYDCMFLVANVSLKTPTTLTELAKENSPAAFKKIDITNIVYQNGYLESHQTEYGDLATIATEQLALKDDSFDYANAKAYIVSPSFASYSHFKILFEVNGEFKTVLVGVNGNATSTTEILMQSIRENLKNGKFTYGTIQEECFTTAGNALEWATPQIENENSN